MIIAIDFDGTLHLGQYPNIGILAPDAADVIRRLRADGHYVILWTCRVGNELLEAVNYLLEKGIVVDRINDNHPDNTKAFGGPTRKVFADIYVDDRQIGGLPTWRDVYAYINNLQNGE